MKKPAAALILLVMISAGASVLASRAQELPAIKLTTVELEDAIALGRTKSKIVGYRVGKKSMMGPLQYELGTLETPFLRVARAAREAVEAYQPFTLANVTKDFAGDYVAFIVPPIDGGSAQRNEAEVVLVMPKKSTDPAAAVRPFQTVTASTTLQNVFGAQWSSDTLIALFDPSVLSPDLEFVVVYKRPPVGGGGASRRELRGVIVDKVTR
jgi:hypothetical protein